MESVKQTRFVFVEEEFPPLAQKALKAQGRTDSPKVGNGLVLKSDNLLVLRKDQLTFCLFVFLVLRKDQLAFWFFVFFLFCQI